MKRLLPLIFMLILTACAPTLKMEQHSRLIENLPAGEIPRTVAILPFTNDTKEPGIDQVVRRTFANHFSAKSYQDIKLPVVDEKLIRMEKVSGRRLAESSPAEISSSLAVEGLLYGRVTDFKWVYAGVYSQLGVEAEVWLVNAGTGKELFRLKEAVRYHEGGIPTSPLSVVVTAVSSALNLRDIQKVRLVNELSYKLMQKLPEPSSSLADTRPAIREVLTNAAEGPFGRRKVVKAGLQGDPGMVATFDIGTFRRGVAMKEVSPGIYSGEYIVLPGDTVSDTPVTVTLSKPGGLDTQWTDVTGYINIDTTPPQSAAGVKAKGYPDRVEINWESISSTPDLKGYRVMRSDSPLSGFSELAKVELTSYKDTSALAGVNYYYRVIPFDQAGNDADAGEGVRGAISGGVPVELSGELKGDMILDTAANVSSDLTVPRGVTLTLSDGARLQFAQDAGLLVYGRLLAKGGDLPVELLPKNAGKWGGISIKGGSADLRRTTVRGAKICLTAVDSEVAVDRVILSGCDTGAELSGISASELKMVTISGNSTGLRLTGSAAKVTGSTIVQNREGVVLDGFSGDMRDNNIFDNEINVIGVKPVVLSPNWLGGINMESLKVENALVETVYDAALPGGKPVAVKVDPFLRMTPEERQRRGTELVIEAGDNFRKRNFGKASTLFADALKAAPTAEIYYYIALCHQEMKEQDKALSLLNEGTAKFPLDPVLWKSMGMLAYEKGDEQTAKKALTEALRLSPDDRQARFVLERVGKQ